MSVVYQMRNRRDLLIFLAFTLTWMVRMSQAQEIQADSAQGEPCFKPELNYIQFYSKEALRHFKDKWPGEDRVTIAIFGDSHVQPDIYPGEMRKQLQAVRGQGGFGMTFPYSTAKTYSAIDYFSSHTGSWLFSKSIEFKPKLPLGVSGVTAKTSDANASIKIKFKKPLPGDYRKLRIYCRQDKKSFDFKIRSGEKEVLVNVDSADRNPIEVVMEELDSAIELQLVKQWDYQTEFELYGISVESTLQGGLILHCLGIGGSRYGSLLEEKLLDEQLPTLQPDLIILDFGTNDFLYDNKLPYYLEDQIVKVILKVRKAAPGASVLLTTAQDMTRRKINITAGEEFADLIRKVAKAQQCPFYDWYWISGGPEKMALWVESGLAQNDMIHLTMKGYVLKGQLLAEALMRSLKWTESPNSADSLVFNVDSLKRQSHLMKDTLLKDSTMAIHRPMAVKNQINSVRHKIIKGETLKSIAKLYHVKTDDLKKTNGLQNSRIIEGNYLNVEIQEGVVNKSSKKSIKAKAKKPSREKYVMHKVVKGETLSELAEKYKVSVGQIKTLNRLRTTRIKVGRSLKIKLKTAPVNGR